MGLDIFGEGITKTQNLLRNNNLLLISHIHIHSYPYDWRSKKPVIQKLTSQWFIDISKINNDIKEALKNVQFVPNSSKNRLIRFIDTRKEWCISRQRCWGVPLPILYYKENDNPILDIQIIDHLVNQIKLNGTEVWFTSSLEGLLPPNLKHLGNTVNSKTVVYEERNIRCMV